MHRKALSAGARAHLTDNTKGSFKASCDWQPGFNTHYGTFQILTAPSRPPEPSKLPSWLNETA
jgi:hypothetical protein